VLAGAFSTALLLTVAAAQTPAAGVEGTWRGTLAAPGTSGLRLVLRISKAADGLLLGSLDSLDQGSTIPIDSVRVTGDTVRIEIKAVAGMFEGTLNAARTELKGTWSQGVPMPLTFTRDQGPPAATPAAAVSTEAARPVTAATFPLGLPFDLHVAVPPTPFVGGDGRTYLVYELQLTNLSQRDLLLKRIEVLDGAATLASHEDAALNGILSLPGTAPGPDRRTVPAGRRAVAFVWIALNASGTPAASLRHRITVDEVTLDGPPVMVSTRKPIVIGPPLEGAGWMAANGPGPGSGHRRALIPVEGGAHIAQRFAIDWLQVDASGRRFAGDAKDNKSYRAYGANVLAVADAVVVATRDGIPENIPGLTSRAVPITLETIGGNHVVLDLGDGQFAFYAHLQPGSLRVKVGDRVKRGQVLGLLGNSGNSTEPHLHFHISNGVSPLGSEGLPYAIDGMTGMPLQNARVNFGK
jgi:murein DD-endopeptidase MepM/ murein hydrolase activator NlpD